MIFPLIASHNPCDQTIQDGPHGRRHAWTRRQPADPSRRGDSRDQNPAEPQSHQDPVPPIPQRQFAMPIRRTRRMPETARVPCRPRLTRYCRAKRSCPGVPPPGARQPFAGRRTLFAELAIQHHLLLAALQLRQVGHSYRSVVGFNTTQGVSFQFVWKMPLDEFPQVGIGRETPDLPLR